MQGASAARTREEILHELATTRHGEWRRIARRIIKDDSLVDDLLHDCWRRVLSSGVNFSTLEEWERYFRAVIVNTSFDYYKGRRRERERLVTLDDGLDKPDARPCPLAQALESERQRSEQRRLEAAIEALSKLPDKQQDAIRWLLLEEKPATLEEISAREGIPISTLRSRMLAGLKRLRKNLRKKGVL